MVSADGCRIKTLEQTIRYSAVREYLGVSSDTGCISRVVKKGVENQIVVRWLIDGLLDSALLEQRARPLCSLMGGVHG